MAQQVMERTTERTQIEAFRDRLKARRNELVDALKGSGIDPDRFIRTALTAAQTTPALVTDVSFQSLWNELLKACRDRLLPDGRQGVIVPYKGKASWQPMYRGLLDRFEQSGHYKWIGCGLHRDDDREFDVWLDEHGQHFLHRPGPGYGQVIETYAAAITKSGGFFLTVVTEQDMARIRSVSRARSDDSPWQQWPDQMRLKSALKRLCKLLPMPQPLEDLMQYEDDDGADETPLAPAAPTRSLPRARGAAAALDQFAGGDGSDELTTKKHAEMQDKDHGGLDRGEPEQKELLTGDKPTDTAQVLLDTAYERGKQAKRDGHKRTAMPGEYREADRASEAAAWRKGWDGEPLDTTGADHAGQ
jgi:phage RecT family recombinase